MLKDFIEGGEYSQYIKLVPEVDFYTKIPEIKKDEQGQPIIPPVILANVDVSKSYGRLLKNTTIDTQVGAKVEAQVKMADVSSVKLNDDGYLTDLNGNKKFVLECPTISVAYRDDPHSDIINYNIPRVLVQREEESYRVSKVVPGTPVNLSEQIGFDSVNMKTFISKLDRIKSLLFKNGLKDQWKEGVLVLLTEAGAKKITDYQEKYNLFYNDDEE